MARNTKRYGLGSFLFDLIFGLITGGLWWVYLAFRFFRRNS